MINLKFTTEDIPLSYSVFLAGPTPRSKDVLSWRPEAVELFKKYTDNLTLFIPEPNWYSGITFEEVCLDMAEVIEWEHKALSIADIILMWVPRELDTMPAFTTNVEFGLNVKSGLLFYGRPDSAPKNYYLDYCYEKFTGRKFSNTLDHLINTVIQEIKSKKGV